MVLERRIARHDYTGADHAFCVETLEVLQITIKKWIFVVPFDLQSHRALICSAYMIDLMCHRSSLPSIYNLADHDIAFVPSLIVQGSPESLSCLGFPSTATDQFNIHDLYARQCPA